MLTSFGSYGSHPQWLQVLAPTDGNKYLSRPDTQLQESARRIQDPGPSIDDPRSGAQIFKEMTPSSGSKENEAFLFDKVSPNRPGAPGGLLEVPGGTPKSTDQEPRR